MNLYVASSWRNDYQQEVVRKLRAAGHAVYDFKNPRPGDNGFHWSEIDPAWKQWTHAEYRSALRHPIAHRGFYSDFNAMREADACVLVLPCGRSAHLEAGWFVGARRPCLILGELAEPELMYAMADSIHEGIDSVLSRLEALECKARTQRHQCATEPKTTSPR